MVLATMTARNSLSPYTLAHHYFVIPAEARIQQGLPQAAFGGKNPDVSACGAVV
jgi:hypothetical protein